MIASMWTRIDDGEGIGPPKRLLVVLHDACQNPLARNRIGDEDHASIETSNGDPPVRDIGNVEFDRHPDHVTQRFRLPHDLPHPELRSRVRLYLASTSPARLATLRAAGIEPTLVSPGVDEEAVAAAAGPLSGPELVLLLARAKAEAVAGSIVDGSPIDGFVLGGDSAFELDGQLYGKPHTAEVARARWHAQRGRTGLLHSGHWLIDHRSGIPAGAVGDVSTSTVTFADVSDAEIDAYVATGEPLAVAGAFTIDSLGSAFITRVEGDPHAVVGLSVSLLRELLLEFDVEWHSLWNRER